jgi:hypothetical protein
MLARAVGFRNYQHMRASQTTAERLARSADAAVDFKQVERTIAQFVAAGLLKQWPARQHVQELCLWVMWSQLPGEQVMHKHEVRGVPNKAHRFEDVAILRRSMIGMKLVLRNLDGSAYRQIEQRPPAEARTVIGEISARLGTQ